MNMQQDNSILTTDIQQHMKLFYQIMNKILQVRVI